MPEAHRSARGGRRRQSAAAHVALVAVSALCGRGGPGGGPGAQALVLPKAAPTSLVGRGPWWLAGCSSSTPGMVRSRVSSRPVAVCPHMVQQLPQQPNLRPPPTPPTHTQHPHPQQQHGTSLTPAAQAAGLVTVPRHVAFVLDGNGRWAAQRGLPRTAGHVEGARCTLDVIERCQDLGIEYVTLFAFSTENWRRPAAEVSALMSLLQQHTAANRARMAASRVRLVVLGQRERLSPPLRALLEEVEGDVSADDAQMTVCLAVSYGGRDDIASAARAVAAAVESGALRAHDVSEEVLASHLGTSRAGVPDPDLVVRTSGERRISNFLLWQAAYAEYHVCAVPWPDFTGDHLTAALHDYASRQRRFGGVPSQQGSGDGSV